MGGETMIDVWGILIRNWVIRVMFSSRLRAVTKLATSWPSCSRSSPGWSRGIIPSFARSTGSAWRSSRPSKCCRYLLRRGCLTRISSSRSSIWTREAASSTRGIIARVKAHKGIWEGSLAHMRCWLTDWSSLPWKFCSGNWWDFWSSLLFIRG